MTPSNSAKNQNEQNQFRQSKASIVKSKSGRSDTVKASMVKEVEDITKTRNLNNRHRFFIVAF